MKPSVLHLNAARTWRGGEQQTLYLAQGLARLGIHQAIVGRPGSALEDRATRAGIEFIAIAVGSELDVISAKQIARLAQERGFKILHAHTAHMHSIGLLARMMNPNVSLVVTRRVDFHVRGLSILKYKNRWVDRFIAISNNVRNILIEDGVPESKISLAFSGIDLSRYRKPDGGSAIRREFNLGRKLVIGNVGALVDHKDQRTLIRAYGLLPDTGKSIKLGKKSFRMPETVLMLVGDGDREAEYKTLAASIPGIADPKSGKRIIFTGFRSDVMSFFATFDILGMSSKEEGLGTSVLEAMASGLPVAATDGGGLPEMIDSKRGGFVTPVGNFEALAESLKMLVLDGAMRRRFAAYNKKRVKDFSVERTVKDTLKVYREILV
ncbi:MAG: glycosyltransferase family 4 protein [Spirochaetia bacterium]|nr:glycosyltransferase family 4 protein [Spirochaetia bacterium]